MNKIYLKVADKKTVRYRAICLFIEILVNILGGDSITYSKYLSMNHTEVQKLPILCNVVYIIAVQ